MFCIFLEDKFNKIEITTFKILKRYPKILSFGEISTEIVTGNIAASGKTVDLLDLSTRNEDTFSEELKAYLTSGEKKKFISGINVISANVGTMFLL